MVEIVGRKMMVSAEVPLAPLTMLLCDNSFDEKRIGAIQGYAKSSSHGEIAADQGQSVLDSEEFGEAGLQTAMRRALASDEAGTKRTDPKLLQRHGPPPL